MFERFTKEARAAVIGAQEVARQTGSHGIDTRHLLVALMENSGHVPRALQTVGADVNAVAATARAELRGGDIDGGALAAIGIDLDAVRTQADAVFGVGALERAARTSGGHIPFTSDAKKALELALREAIRLQHRRIRAGHLLLGILRAECPGSTLLQRAGVDTDALRQALEEHTRAA